jgi:two-component sensor histidine kinase
MPAVPTPPRRALRIGSEGLTIAIVALIIAAGTAFWAIATRVDHDETMEGARRACRDMALLLEEHTRRSLAASDLVLERAIDVVGNRPLAVLRHSQEDWARLHDMAGELAQVGVIKIVDAAGDAVLDSSTWPTPDFNAFGREHVTAHREAGTALFVGSADGRPSGEVVFTISRRLADPDGSFKGVVTAEILTRYFADYYASLDLDPGSILSVFRLDGKAMIHRPGSDDEDVGFGAALLGDRPEQEAAGTFVTDGAAGDGPARIVCYRRLADWPCIAVSSVTLKDALAGWRGRTWLSTTGLIAAIVTTVLLSVMAVGSIRRDRATRTALEAALANNDILFREIHHRVKNNLQIVSSLLRLQSRRLDDEDARQAFAVALARIQSMGLVHEIIYRHPNPRRVNFRTYFEELCSTLARSSDAAERGIVLEVASEDVFVDLPIAVPLALIVNEAVTNALKHAFPEGRGGRIEVRASSWGGMCSVVVADDGVGFAPRAGPERSGSEGITLIRALARQIGGRAEISALNGTRVTVTFPLARPGAAPAPLAEAAAGVER